MQKGFSDSIVQVTAAILVKDGKVLIAQRGPQSHQADKWEFPGGKVEGAESPGECLEREMMEEFNIVVSVGEHLDSSVYHYDHISIELMAFRAYWISGTLTLKDHAAFEWVEVSELDQYDFAPADVPFVEQLIGGDIEL